MLGTLFCVQAFLDSAKLQGGFQPRPSPPLALSAPDQARIRDRSTIVARHLFADRGAEFADEQAWPFHVSQLLTFSAGHLVLSCKA
jgi:hypothetical protein